MNRLGWRLATTILRVSAWALALVNFWVFSRFTVDDAFITWRYGRNLVEQGVWNYNPSTFDPTQAYTNPVYALISLIPALFGWNVVLFFKLFSLLLVVGFIVWFIRRRPMANLPLALFFAIPATMIHIFSGLETLLFVICVFVLFLAVQENSFAVAMAVTSLLFLTRPEAWLLGLLVPLALSIRMRGGKSISNLRINWRTFLMGTAILGAVLVAYFSIHLWLFGDLLPNTFYVKSGRGMKLYYLVNLAFILLPLVPLYLAGLRRVTLLAGAFYVPIIFNYSSSAMGMDYASRYAFHIFAPLALLGIYVLTSEAGRARISKRVSWLPKRTLSGVVVFALALGFLVPTLPQNVLSLANYYPRLLDAQGQVGLLAKESAKAMSISDSGLAPYLAEIPNLDTTLLGTKIGAKNGVSQKLFDDYGVDFVALRDRKKLRAMMEPILDKSKLVHVCDVYFGPEYRIQLWLAASTDRALEVCASSKAANDLDDRTYLSANLTNAPWNYWQ